MGGGGSAAVFQALQSGALAKIAYLDKRKHPLCPVLECNINTQHLTDYPLVKPSTLTLDELVVYSASCEGLPCRKVDVVLRG